MSEQSNWYTLPSSSDAKVAMYVQYLFRRKSGNGSTAFPSMEAGSERGTLAKYGYDGSERDDL
jgi:hypothetical protein